MIGTRVAFRGAFGPHEGIVLEETEDSVVLAVEKRHPRKATRSPMMSACNNNQAFFNKRVIPTKITAPTKATMIAPIMPPPGQIPNSPKTQPPTTPPEVTFRSLSA